MKKENILSNKYFIALLALISTFLWGSAFPCIKIGYNLFNITSSNTWTQILFAGFRFFLAGIITIIIGSFSSKKILIPSKKALPKILLISLFQTVLQYVFFYLGLAQTSGVKSSIIGASGTLFAILISCYIFKSEKISKNKIIGCALGFLGVILVNLNSSIISINFKLSGEGFILLSTIAYAFSSSLLKKYSKYDNPVMLSGYQFIIGGLFMIILSKIMGGNIPNSNIKGITVLIYLAFVSGIAYSLWGLLLKHNPVSKVTIYGFMTPIFGSVLSLLALNENSEELGIKALIALILVCIGIFILNRPATS